MQENDKDLSSTKDLFFNNIAHEFRTPLSLIISPAQQLLHEIDNPVHHQKLKMINRNAIYLKQLIDQLLALAKIDDGQEGLKIHGINGGEFFKELFMPFNALAEIKSISYNYKIVGLDKLLFIDTLKIKIILNNLIANAIKFTPEKGEVDVSTICINQTIRIRISDTGIGIKKSKIPHVFDRFYQEDRHVKHYIGTGIGLALCKELVTQLKGKIYVESEPGEGSIFFVEIPCCCSQEEVHETYPNNCIVDTQARKIHKEVPDIESVSKTYEIDENTENPVILLVEDNDEIRTLLKEACDGYTILEANNGQDGVDLAMKYIPRIVVTDLMMPDMDGFEMIEILRGDFRTNHIPVVVVSALNEVQHRLDALAKGASAYIPKPFNLNEVKLQVDNLLALQNKEQSERAKEFLTFKEDLSNVDLRFIENINEVLNQHISEEHFSVENLSVLIGVSRVQLHRKLKAITGYSSSVYIKRYKMAIASNWLTSTSLTVSEVSYKLGYTSVAHFSRSFKEVFDYSPSKYKVMAETK